jgi:ribonuclease HI
MIHEYTNGQSNQNLKKQFRRSGPLDAYIYQKGGDDSDVKETQQNVFVHLPEPRKETIFHIFTDGACTNNGKRNANAAWACLLVSDDGYIVLDRASGAIPLSEPQTNQRAELTALLRGLEVAERQIRGNPHAKIQIWSDSEYSINCASVWGPKWKSRGWKKQGGEIQHLDLIRILVEKTQVLGFTIQYKWLKGHKGGDSQFAFPWMFNHQVDALATQALR